MGLTPVGVDTFLWGILSLIIRLPKTHNCVRWEDFSFKFFWLKRTFCLCLLHLNLTMTQFCFFKQLHEWSCSGITLTPVKQKALPTFSSKVFSQKFSGTVFVSIISVLWYWELLQYFFPVELFFELWKNYSGITDSWCLQFWIYLIVFPHKTIEFFNEIRKFWQPIQ